MTPKQTGPRKLVAYYRVSTDKQGKSRLGLDSQQATVAAHACSIGGSVVQSFEEVESGKRADRPELARAIAYARKHGATLIVAKLDRLSRNTIHFLRMVEESGVRFYFCDFPQIPEGPMGRLFLTLMISFAEFERGVIGERTRAAMRQLQANGCYSRTLGRKVSIGGARANTRPPSRKLAALGGTISGERRTSEALAAYAEIEPLLTGAREAGKSLRTIARELNDAGHRTRQGAEWTAAAVLKVLRRSACVTES